MQRVHHFSSSSDALDASLAERDVREGDALVIAAERIVGIASTDPIAVTVSAGPLRAFPPLPRERLLAELVHDQAAIGFAVDEAARHGFPVAAHYNEFGSIRSRTVENAAHVVFSLDDIAVVLDAIDRRAAALEPPADALDGDSSDSRDQHHVERLRAARERLASYTRLIPSLSSHGDAA